MASLDCNTPRILITFPYISLFNAVIPARLKQQQPKLTLEKLKDSGWQLQSCGAILQMVDWLL